MGTDAVPEAAVTAGAGLTADSREVEPGFAFAALPGTKVDGANILARPLHRPRVFARRSYSGAGLVIETPNPPALPDGGAVLESSQISRWR